MHGQEMPWVVSHHSSFPSFPFSLRNGFSGISLSRVGSLAKGTRFDSSYAGRTKVILDIVTSATGKRQSKGEIKAKQKGPLALSVVVFDVAVCSRLRGERQTRLQPGISALAEKNNRLPTWMPLFFQLTSCCASRVMEIRAGSSISPAVWRSAGCSTRSCV